MSKAEIVDAIAAVVPVSKANAAIALECVVDAIKDGLERDGTVKIKGFGTFYLHQRAARTGRNPLTGAPVEIRAAWVLKFRAAKALADEFAE